MAEGLDRLRIAVLLPCYNEEAAGAQTVAGFPAAARASADSSPQLCMTSSSSSCPTIDAERGAKGLESPVNALGVH